MKRLDIFREKIAARSFLDPNSGCQIWTGDFSAYGYGRFDYMAKSILAHRASYEAHYGTAPGKLLVCHTCDNPSCVNPKHLFLGTHGDNLHDCMSKNRMQFRPRKGEQNGFSKLTQDSVRAILADLDVKTPVLTIAKKYGVSRATIYWIKHGITWTHVSDKPDTKNQSHP